MLYILSGLQYNNGDNHSQQNSSTVQQKVIYSNAMHSQATGNLNELDSLLNDLSNARYGSRFDQKRKLLGGSWHVVWIMTLTRKYFVFVFLFFKKKIKNLEQQNNVKDANVSQDIIDQIQRPSVDTLLDELNVRSTSPVYAVPHDEVINCLISVYS